MSPVSYIMYINTCISSLLYQYQFKMFSIVNIYQNEFFIFHIPFHSSPCYLYPQTITPSSSRVQLGEWHTMAGNVCLDQVAGDEEFSFTSRYASQNTGDADEHKDIIPTIDDTQYYSTDQFNNLTNSIDMHDKLSCMHINCQSLNANWDSIKHFVNITSSKTHQFDIIGLSETFGAPNKLDLIWIDITHLSIISDRQIMVTEVVLVYI